MFRKILIGAFVLVAIAMVGTHVNAKICPRGQISLGGTCWPWPGSVSMDTIITGLGYFDVGDQVELRVFAGANADENESGDKYNPGGCKFWNSGKKKNDPDPDGGPNVGTFVPGNSGAAASDASKIETITEQGIASVFLSAEWIDEDGSKPDGVECSKTPTGQTYIGFTPYKFQLAVEHRDGGSGQVEGTFGMLCWENPDYPIDLEKDQGDKFIVGQYLCVLCEGDDCYKCVDENGENNGTCQSAF